MSRSFSKSIRARVAALDLVSSLCQNIRRYNVRVGRPSHLRRSLERTEARIVKLMRMTVGVDTMDDMSDKRRRSYERIRQNILGVVDDHYPGQTIDFIPYMAMVMDVVDSVVFCIPAEHKRVRLEWSLLLGSVSAMYRHLDPDWTHPEQGRVQAMGDDIARLLDLKWPCRVKRMPRLRTPKCA